MKKQCVKCGLHIKDETNKLWCSHCMEKVMEELEGKADRPFRYYFSFNLKRMRHENKKMGEMLKADGKNRKQKVLH